MAGGEDFYFFFLVLFFLGLFRSMTYRLICENFVFRFLESLVSSFDEHLSTDRILLETKFLHNDIRANS